ncbi:hypothetical protein ACELLULO517_07470 [Acidisoma cellulosilytica]|uniref:Uncharacterized protein n=1 Tax=Acidisoma cellulosilyticum TaxID=2802395 RepID=A0A963YZS0_9PROT|nr:hypothetical protein [Acidisoma cellulosilyticum]MCB8880069.1 hypothetical protein [Acidisoma cellulosilyticum]
MIIINGHSYLSGPIAFDITEFKDTTSSIEMTDVSKSFDVITLQDDGTVTINKSRLEALEKIYDLSKAMAEPYSPNPYREMGMQFDKDMATLISIVDALVIHVDKVKFIGDDGEPLNELYGNTPTYWGPVVSTDVTPSEPPCGPIIEPGVDCYIPSLREQSHEQK